MCRMADAVAGKLLLTLDVLGQPGYNSHLWLAWGFLTGPTTHRTPLLGSRPFISPSTQPGE
jgi:hypothetical protein